MSTTLPRRTRVKICGLTSVEAARTAVAAGADAIGLVFAADSPRRIDARRAAAIVRALPPLVTAVCVHARPDGGDPDALDGIASSWCQIHDVMAPEALAALAARRPVIRGFRFDPAAVRTWDECPHVTALLVDGSAGGAGTTFDHEALAKMRDAIRKPLILAGGLTPANVGAAIRLLRPFAVDVSSGVEAAPGVKDPELIEAFCRAVREADRDATGRRAG